MKLIIRKYFKGLLSPSLSSRFNAIDSYLSFISGIYSNTEEDRDAENDNKPKPQSLFTRISWFWFVDCVKAAQRLKPSSADLLEVEETRQQPLRVTTPFSFWVSWQIAILYPHCVQQDVLKCIYTAEQLNLRSSQMWCLTCETSRMRTLDRHFLWISTLFLRQGLTT